MGGNISKDQTKPVWVALLRGINVGGRNVLPMKDLRTLLSRLGYEDVQTYIQSGNCIFRAEASDPGDVSKTITDAIAQAFSFSPAVHVLGLDDLEKALAQQPYPEAANDPKTLHFFFLSESVAPEKLETLRALCTPTEQITLSDGVLYLYAPDGIGRSKVASNVEAKLKVSGTGRNLRTVMKLDEMARRTSVAENTQ